MQVSPARPSRSFSFSPPVFFSSSLVLPLTHTFPFFFFFFGHRDSSHPPPLSSSLHSCLQFSRLSVLHLVRPIFPFTFFSVFLPLFLFSPTLPSFPSLSSYTHFASLLLFYCHLSSLCSLPSPSGPPLLSYVPSAALLFTPIYISYLTRLPPSSPLQLPLFPPLSLLVLSPPASLSGHRPHTWLIDF